MDRPREPSEVTLREYNRKKVQPGMPASHLRTSQELRRSNENLVRQLEALKRQQQQARPGSREGQAQTSQMGNSSSQQQHVHQQRQQQPVQAAAASKAQPAASPAGAPRRENVVMHLIRKLSPTRRPSISKTAEVEAATAEAPQDAALVADAQEGVHNVLELSPARQQLRSKTKQGLKSPLAQPAVTHVQASSHSAPGAVSPSKLQLQAVRAIGAAQHVHQTPLSEGRAGEAALTPGCPDTIMRNINAAIASRVENLLQTPPELAAPAQPIPAGRHPSKVDTIPAGQQQKTGLRLAVQQSFSPFGTLPQPPAAPTLPLPANTESMRELPQTPFFMTSKTKALFCEMDDPGRNIAFPKSHRRTGRMRRALATMFGGCFVPPPISRSPAPSLRTPSSRKQAGLMAEASRSAESLPQLAITANVNPLRNSVADLFPQDGEIQEHLRVSLALAAPPVGPSPAPAMGAAGAGPQPRVSPFYADLLGMADQAQVNMGSPVQPVPFSSSGRTPPEGSPYAAHGAAADNHAKRNLMESLPARRTRVSVHELASGRATDSEEASRVAGRLLPQRARQAQLGQQQPRQVSPQGMCRSGSKRGREALGPSLQASALTSPKVPKRDLSKPTYRSNALHAVLSPSRPSPHAAAAAAGGAEVLPCSKSPTMQRSKSPALQRHASVTASPAVLAYKAAAAGAAPQQMAQRPPGSPPGRARPASSPPRMTKAAEMRAAAAQRDLQQRQQQANAYLAHSPSKALREAAAAGLSLRQAAAQLVTLTSPGKTSRVHRHRSETPADQAAALATGEEGVEPFSARLHTKERQRRRAVHASVRRSGTNGSGNARRPAQAAAPVPMPAAPKAAAAAVPAVPDAVAAPVAARQVESGGSQTVDLQVYEEQRQSYLEMLHKLASGLQMDDLTALQQAKARTPPPLPAELIAAAAAAAQGALQQGSRGGGKSVPGPPLQAAGQEEEEETSLSGTTVAYSPRLPAEDSSCQVNGLFAASPLESPSERVAQQRMVSMTVAATVKRSLDHLDSCSQQQQQQQGSASGQRESISFGSVGLAGSSSGQQQQQRQQASAGSSCPSNQSLLAPTAGADLGAGMPTVVSKPSGGHSGAARERAIALADALAQSSGGMSLEQLLAVGYTLEDVKALKQLLDDQPTGVI